MDKTPEFLAPAADLSAAGRGFRAAISAVDEAFGPFPWRRVICVCR
ncbi:MAG: hypothetical protein ABSF16_13345 [Terracidiphilus sp.]